MVLLDVLMHPDEYDGNTIVAPWRPLVGEQLEVLHVSIFGNFFFVDTSGRVLLLDSWSGELHGVSTTYADYKASVGSDAEFFRCWFLTELAELLIAHRMKRMPGQVYAPFVSPALGGSLTPANFSLAPVRAYVAVSAAEVLSLRGLSNLPGSRPL